MLCPLCKTEMKIGKTRIILENDDTPDKETKVYDEMDMMCRNKTCANFDKVVETIRSLMDLG